MGNVESRGVHGDTSCGGAARSSTPKRFDSLQHIEGGFFIFMETDQLRCWCGVRITLKRRPVLELQFLNWERRVCKLGPVLCRREIDTNRPRGRRKCSWDMLLTSAVFRQGYTRLLVVISFDWHLTNKAATHHWVSFANGK